MISPPICEVIGPASRSMPAARCTLKWPQPAVAPVSSRTSAANSAVWASSRSAALLSLARRAEGPCADQAGNAAAAASTAVIATAPPAAGLLLTRAPETGLQRGNVAPERAARRAPPISNLTSFIGPFLVQSGLQIQPLC